MKKDELREKINAVQNELYHLVAAKKTEYDSLIKEKHQPMIDAAERVRDEIKKSVREKHDSGIVETENRLAELKKQMDEIKVAENQNRWHPPGTVVRLWEKPYSFSREKKPNDKTGTVAVYDGSIPIGANVAYYNRPSPGDIVVYHHKKDGTPGKSLTQITDGGKFRYTAYEWLIDGETPQDNLAKRIEQAERENAE